MGNSSSHSDKHYNKEIEVTTEEIYFEKLANSSWHITKDKFMEVLNQPCSLIDALWNKFCHNPNIMNLDEFKLLIRHLENSRDKIALFTELLRNNFNENDIETLCIWFYLAVHESSIFVQSLKSAFLSYVGTMDETGVSPDEFLTWSRRNLPDLAHDLHLSLLHSLYKGATVKPLNDVRILIPAIDYSTGLINNITLSLMSACVPDSYKKHRHDHEGNLNMFESQKFGHIQKLFDSKQHGFSSSKLRENVLDYPGHLIMMLKADNFVLCVLSDEGFKESFNSYGGIDSRLIMLLPKFSKYVSGKVSPAGKKPSGIIYSHFTSKSGKHGIFVGHDPLSNPVLEIDEGITQIKFLGADCKLDDIEVWAAGNPDLLHKHQDIKSWEKKEVEKNKNRKLKADWEDSPDRHILSLGGVQVNHSDMVGGKDKSDPDSVVPSQ